MKLRDSQAEESMGQKHRHAPVSDRGVSGGTVGTMAGPEREVRHAQHVGRLGHRIHVMQHHRHFFATETIWNANHARETYATLLKAFTREMGYDLSMVGIWERWL